MSEIIKSECKACGAAYAVRVEFAGRKARCQKCGEKFIVENPKVEIPSDDLTACRFCGFQDSGNFCSNCGGRLSDLQFSTIPQCLIDKNIIKKYQAKSDEMDWDAPGGEMFEDAVYSMEELNRNVLEIANAIQNGDDYVSGLLSRVEAEQLLDKIPTGDPQLNGIRAYVWTLVSDIEQYQKQKETEDIAVRQSAQLDYHVKSFDAAVDAGSEARAKKWFGDIRVLLEDGRKPTVDINELENRLEEFLKRRTLANLAKNYTKLEEKAAKLLFKGEDKKAGSAYQDCLFWLSRNEHPEHAKMVEDAESGLSQTQ